MFYNGQYDEKVESVQKLSDAYLDSEEDDNVSLELVVKVININTRAGGELLRKCKVLEEYSKFVEKVREYKNAGVDDYMKSAITYCIKNHILEEYLSRKGSEVVNFLCAEYDYEMDIEVQREESYEKGLSAGLEQGMEQGRQQIMITVIKEGIKDKKEEKEVLEQLVRYFSLTETEAKEMYNLYSV